MRISDHAKPKYGRNAGKMGKIIEIDPKQSSVLIEFAGLDFKHPDYGWFRIEKIEIKENLKKNK